MILRYAARCGQTLCLFVLAHSSCFAQNNTDTNLRNIAAPTFYVKNLAATGALTLAGLATSGDIRFKLAELRNEHAPNFYSRIDDGLAFTPLLAVYILDLSGVPAKNNTVERSIILLKGELLCVGSVQLLKRIIAEPRPNLSDDRSMPSMHTAQAFLGATLLSEEFKEEIPWIPYAAYGVAGATGILRIANNEHYINDVLIGAALGVLTQRIAYWTHRYAFTKRKRRQHFR